MITCLAKFWIRESDSEEKKRRVYGTLGAVVGIFLNICLFTGKYLAGFLSGSIAIMADAFNNLSDAGSSFISLIGFVFSGKKPDLDHPFGHGRIEYLAGLGVSFLILLMGVELAKIRCRRYCIRSVYRSVCCLSLCYQHPFWLNCTWHIIIMPSGKRSDQQRWQQRQRTA